jgi:hypothetical protein
MRPRLATSLALLRQTLPLPGLDRRGTRHTPTVTRLHPAPAPEACRSFNPTINP